MNIQINLKDSSDKQLGPTIRQLLQASVDCRLARQGTTASQDCNLRGAAAPYLLLGTSAGNSGRQVCKIVFCLRFWFIAASSYLVLLFRCLAPAMWFGINPFITQFQHDLGMCAATGGPSMLAGLGSSSPWVLPGSATLHVTLVVVCEVITTCTYDWSNWQVTWQLHNQGTARKEGPSHTLGTASCIGRWSCLGLRSVGCRQSAVNARNANQSIMFSNSSFDALCDR